VRIHRERSAKKGYIFHNVVLNVIVCDISMDNDMNSSFRPMTIQVPLKKEVSMMPSQVLDLSQSLAVLQDLYEDMMNWLVFNNN